MRIVGRTAIALAILTIPAACIAQSPVTFEKIEHSASAPNPGNWLTYGGNLAAQRFSELKQIHTANVNSLKVAWVYQMGGRGVIESVPLVNDGIMYVTEPPSTVVALDARTGKALWQWSPQLPRDMVVIGLFPTNRGVALLGNNVYVNTIDAHLACLDAKTGREKWSVEVADNKEGFADTGAPLAINGKIIVGVGGGEAGAHGFLSAFDANDGKLLWRLYTVPRSPSDPGADTWANGSWSNGGGTTWNTGSYDPETNTIYWGTGNPAPDWNGEGRLGDNLFTCSLLAIDANTGKMKWYFQFSPHETHDWDSSEPPILFDAQVDGQPRKLVALANRNAFYYVLDRVSGKFITGVPFAKQSWAKGLDQNGRPIENPNIQPTPEGNLVYPSLTGGVNWTSPCYSPLTGLFYVNARDAGAWYIQGEAKMAPGNSVGVVGGGGGGGRFMMGDQDTTSIRALDAVTGKRVWNFEMVGDSWTGVLATAGNLVFSADAEGNFFALNATTGENLWHINLGAPLRSNPMTYAVDGHQYVADSSGNSLFVFDLPQE
ncbi:MAG: PQQ-dependent dehydrogenase, methanol/ethanol family [Acidobacteriota bacterium]|nr:PQQ-dependent dehydrogenase, methanol/ethanol family [Acidobacteriota bacterium]